MRKSYRDRSIFEKVLIGCVAVVVCMAVITGACTPLLVRAYVVQTNMDELMSKAVSLASVTHKSNSRPDAVTVPRMREVEALTGARVLTVGTDMVVRQIPAFNDEAVNAEQIRIADQVDQQLVASLLAGRTAVDVRFVEFLGADILFAGAPVTDKDGTVVGALLLYRPMADVSDVAVKITLTTFAAAVLAILAACALSWTLSRRLTKPLLQLTAGANRMAEGHYGERVQLERGDEIGQLASSLNFLSGRLDEVIGQLRDENIKLEQILSGIGEGIVAVNPSGDVVHENNAALALLEDFPDKRDELVGMLKNAVDTAARAQTVWKGEGGRSISVEASPFSTSEGAVLGAVGLMRDVSESERLEQLRRDYVANISHELRTPLTGIRGMVEPLMDGIMETEEEKQDCYNVIYQETLRLQKLIGEMLDMSRLQDGRLKLELEPLELPGVMESAARRFRDRAHDGDVRLVVRPDEMPPAMGDENRVLQVLIILLDNALSFTPPGGEVEVYARATKEAVWVGVRDTGAGIDPKDLPFIWERFYKADRSRMRTSGTGLGLAIAKLTTTLMGGEITVQSEPGKGATFEFSLRRADVRERGEG